MRPYRLDSAKDRLTETRDVISRLGKAMVRSTTQRCLPSFRLDSIPCGRCGPRRDLVAAIAGGCPAQP